MSSDVQGRLEALLFFAMMIGFCLGVAELWFTITTKHEVPTKENDEDDGS